MIHPEFRVAGVLWKNLNRSDLPAAYQGVWKVLDQWNDPRSYMTIQSSGTITGRPKDFQIQKDKMAHSAQMTIKFLQLQSGDRAWLTLSTDYIGGMMMVIRAAVAGLDLYADFPEIDQIKDSSRPAQIHLAAMVPLQVRRLFLEAPEKLQGLEHLLIGGGPVGTSLRDDVQELSGKVYSTFGMTETISHIALQQLNGANASVRYQTLPGIEISSRQNCLFIEAPGLLDAPLQTRDVVNLHGTDSFEWLGRSDFMINSGGVKLFPEQIEQKLSAQLNAPFAIVGLPHPALGEQVVLVVEGQKPAALDWSLLERYEVPKTIKSIEQFPRTDTGKIRRSRLVEILLNKS